MQLRHQRERDRSKLAMGAAIEEYKAGMSLAMQVQKQGATVSIAPLTASIHYHYRCMELLEQGKLNKDSLDQLGRERDTLFPEEE